MRKKRGWKRGWYDTYEEWREKDRKEEERREVEERRRAEECVEAGLRVWKRKEALRGLRVATIRQAQESRR
jgi:hypothetical protein